MLTTPKTPNQTGILQIITSSRSFGGERVTLLKQFKASRPVSHTSFDKVARMRGLSKGSEREGGRSGAVVAARNAVLTQNTTQDTNVVLIPTQHPRQGTPRQPDSPTIWSNPNRFNSPRTTHTTFTLPGVSRGYYCTWVITRTTRGVPNWKANSSSTTETRVYTAKAAITSQVADPLTTLRVVMIGAFRPSWYSAASRIAEFFESKTW